MGSKKKLLRQGMGVSIAQLRRMADMLEKESINTDKHLRLKMSSQERLNQMWEVSIINKQPSCSDTWELEFKDE